MVTFRQAFGRFAQGFAEGFASEFIRLSDVSRHADEVAEAVPEVVIEEDEVSDQLLLELTERVHERTLSRLDALDTVLVGLMAAILAVGAIAIDKHDDFKKSLIWFVASLACCAFGWLWGNLFYAVRESVDPVYLIAGAESQGADMIPLLTADMATAYRSLQRARIGKMIAVATAIALLFVGLAIAIHQKGGILGQ